MSDASRRARYLHVAQYAVLAAFVAWVAVHSVVIGVTGWSPWRLGGLGMYAAPGRNYRAAVVIECRTPTCDQELGRVKRAVRRSAGPSAVRVFRARSEPGRLEVLGTARPVPNEPFRDFLHFPGPGTAQGLLDAVLIEPRGTYVVVHIRQRVSLIKREADADHRAYVVRAKSP